MIAKAHDALPLDDARRTVERPLSPLRHLVKPKSMLDSRAVDAYLFTLIGACLFLFLCPPAHGQTSSKAPCGDPQKAAEEKDPIAIVELGAATSWNVSGGAATFAPNLAAEMTPIENWLELEVGVSPFYTRNSTEWDTDLLFKKPWTISRKAEFMLGVGPEWVHLRQNGKVTNSICWGDSGRLHVLANRQTSFRLVPRTGLRLQLCRRPPAIHRDERWSPHRNSMIVTQLRTHHTLAE